VAGSWRSEKVSVERGSVVHFMQVQVRVITVVVVTSTPTTQTITKTLKTPPMTFLPKQLKEDHMDAPFHPPPPINPQASLLQRLQVHYPRGGTLHGVLSPHAPTHEHDGELLTLDEWIQLREKAIGEWRDLTEAEGSRDHSPCVLKELFHPKP